MKDIKIIDKIEGSIISTTAVDSVVIDHVTPTPKDWACDKCSFDILHYHL